MALALLLAGASLAHDASAGAATAAATATIRIYWAIRLNDAVQLDRANAHIRSVRVLTEGKVQHLRVAEFE